jgi:hypothetical protein
MMRVRAVHIHVRISHLERRRYEVCLFIMVDEHLGLAYLFTGDTAHWPKEITAGR